MTTGIPMSEADLMRAVTDLAEILGWSWAHFRPAQTARGWRTPVSGPLGKGFPDLVLVRPRDGRLLFVELKGAAGKPTPEQDVVHKALSTAAQTYLWRPWHLDSGEIQSVLR